MRRIAIASLSAVLLSACSASPNIADGTAVSERIVEASCGQCRFGIIDPPGCDLAIRMDEQVYFVDGAGIDDFGDAHASDGFCQAIRTARVSGTIEHGRFHATSFDLLPNDDDAARPRATSD